MDQLNYRFECLDGNYELQIDFDENEANYEIRTTLPGFVEFIGILGKEKTQAFRNKLIEAKITNWDRCYEATGSSIEDAVKWSLIYSIQDKEYRSEGEETYEPYGYEHLIEALVICDEKANFFKEGI